MNLKHPATMKDVAAKAGVSLSTVSYVLSGTRPISETTRQLILKTMDELHFQPNAVARALASKRTRVIALLLSPQERGLGMSEMEFVRAATMAATETNQHLVLLTEGMESEEELRYLKRQGLIDGVVLMEVRLGDPRPALFQQLGFPFALIGRPDNAPEVPWVDIDFEATFEKIVSELTHLGHQHLGLVNQGQETFDAGYGPVVRAQGAFHRWCGVHGATASAVFSAATPRDGWRACHTLLDAPQPPTALVVMNDRALPGVLQALAARGLRIPDDISVVSAVTSPLAAAMMVPALTSADAPSTELARLAVANLVQAIETPDVLPENRTLACQWTPRASTAPPPPPRSRRTT